MTARQSAWGAFAMFLGRHRRWSWPVLGLLCDIRMRRRGRRCIGWSEHRDMMR